MRVAELPVLLVALLGHRARPATAQPAGGGDWSSDADSGDSGDSGGDSGGDGDFSDSGPTCAWHCYSCDGVHMTDGVHTIGHGTCVSSQSWPKSERLGPGGVFD